MAYKTSMNKTKKISSVKGVSTRGLTSRQATMLNSHADHHTVAHLEEMVKEMRRGKTFNSSHNIAMNKIGK